MSYKERLVSISSIISSFLAALCCVGAPVLLALGIAVSGSFIAGFEWLRPYFIALAFVFSALSYRYAYVRGSACKAGVCDIKARRINRALFWATTAFAAFAVFSPYLTA